METVNETSAGDATRRIIKRYSNRKLYDTRDSRYVTLQQIGAMVRAGEEVQIIDNATKEDKTEGTLALIISEDLKAKPRSVPLGTLRDLIQERGERLLSQLREGPIGRLIPSVVADGAPPADEATSSAAPAAPEPPSVGLDGGAREPPQSPPDAALKRSGGTLPGPVPAAPTETDKQAPKGRLSEIVESSKHTLDQWQHNVDERVRAIVPGLGAFNDLQADVKRLAQRVDDLEARLAEIGAVRRAGDTSKE